MEQKRKRVRPSLTQMRALQAELNEVKENYRLMIGDNKHLSEEVRVLIARLLDKEAECDSQIEGTSGIVQDCNAWREKFRGLQKKYDEQIEETSHLVADCNAWREKYQNLFSKYKNLETLSARGEDARQDEYKLRLELERGLQRVRKANQSLSELNDERLSQIGELKSRGFFARLFNL